MRIGEAQRSYRLRTTPMRDEDGKLLGAVTVLEDVTQMQEVDRFKTRFISVASQKLRDPLQRIRLSLYTLAKGFGGELKPFQADLLQGAEEEAEALNDLMADLIEVAELDTGRRELKIERLRPIDVLQEARDRWVEEACAKRIDIEVNAFADLSHINADRRALRSIFDNLLSNAIRYTPAEGSIVLRAEEIKDRVQFFVRDSGRGIEAERLPQNLRPFRHLGRHRRRHRSRPRAGPPPRRGPRRTSRRREPSRRGHHLQLHRAHVHRPGHAPPRGGGLMPDSNPGPNANIDATSPANPIDPSEPHQITLTEPGAAIAPEPANLRIYIGAAPGVGKTFQMLETAHLMRKQGIDVVIGLIETHGRADTAGDDQRHRDHPA